MTPRSTDGITLAMPTGTLTLDLDALTQNWRALDACSAPDCETAAVVKADGYGLGLAQVVQQLFASGVRSFFVVSAQEGAEVREAIGPTPRIFTLYGHMEGDTELLRTAGLIPMLSSPEQLERHRAQSLDHPFGIQLDTGMSRLGLTTPQWDAVRQSVVEAGPELVMSHLASADTPESEQNADQLKRFRAMTAGIDAPLSLAATGGILLGSEYHFDLTRPGIGLYGGLPFADATPVVDLRLPVISCFDLPKGASVGYGATWTAQTDTRIATVAGGYADGLFRALQPEMQVFAGDIPCPVRGRVSMDLLTVDIGHLDRDPGEVTVLGLQQTVDDLARAAGTIGYEILTSLGGRYSRTYQHARVD